MLLKLMQNYYYKSNMLTKVKVFMLLILLFVGPLGGCKKTTKQEDFVEKASLASYEYNSSCLLDNTCLLDNNGTPSKPLLKLLSLLEVKHNGTLAEIVKKTQKVWLRSKEKELWEVDNKIFADKHADILLLLNDLGCVQEINPSKKQYTYGIVLGALVSRVRSRLAFLANLWNKGIRFDKLVFLAGQRKLDSKQESKEKLLDYNNSYLSFKKDWLFDGIIPKTETDMIKFVFSQSDLPEDMRCLPVQFVDTLSRVLPDGTVKRPTTNDTIFAWLRTNPKPGTCLVVSNQPYIGRQDSALKTLLPKNFKIETVGRAIQEPSKKIGVILDTIARCLYQEYKRISGMK